MTGYTLLRCAVVVIDWESTHEDAVSMLWQCLFAAESTFGCVLQSHHIFPQELGFWPEQPAADMQQAKQESAAGGDQQQQQSPAQPAAPEKLPSLDDAVNIGAPSTNDTADDEEPPPADR
jgi:hypothetical protein